MTNGEPCCSPATPRPARGARPHVFDGQRRVADQAVLVPGGPALLGTAHPIITLDGEGPLRKRRVKPFLIGSLGVTNGDFAAFVDATGYVTDAERFSWSFVFDPPHGHHVPSGDTVPGAPWWRRREGADWRRPDGQTEAPKHHPVTQVSWADAVAYASWVGGRLPTEVEWEHAARGGLGDVPFPWGTAEPNDTEHFPCNIWQGQFPHQNSGRDGYQGTSPVDAFEPNAFGLFNMVGNVWEWTSDAYRVSSLKKAARAHAAQMRGFKVLKGGSFLCHRSYCFRYRIAARTGNSPDSTTMHQGFRVVWDVKPTHGNR